MPKANRKALIMLTVAYAIYAPFWIAILFIDLELIKRQLQPGYGTGCLFIAILIMLPGSFFAIGRSAYKTKELVEWFPHAEEFAGEVVLNTVILMILTILFFAAYPVVTYRFLD